MCVRANARTAKPSASAANSCTTTVARRAAFGGSEYEEKDLTPRPSLGTVRGRGQSMEHIFLTYDEAGKRLGIKPDSVRRRARSRKWPRRQGNDGRALVGIPPDILRADDPPGPPPGPPPGAPTDMEAAELRVENRMLRERVEELKAERDAWQSQAERLASEPRPVVAGRGLFSRLFSR